MDSGPAHPSRLLPTWTMILPNSGKPEVGGASTMCNCTSGNDECGTPSSIFKQHVVCRRSFVANTASRSRRAFRASFAINLPPSAIRGRGERRAPLAPAASCALCIGRKHTSNNEYPGITRRSRTQWFYGLLRALPGDRALLPPSSNGLRSCPRPVGPTNLRELDTSIGVSEPHDFTVRSNIVRQHAADCSQAVRRPALPPRVTPDAAASTASRPAFLTIANRPSVGWDGEFVEMICPTGEAKYFCKGG